jgi:stress-induced morphogen
MRNARASMAMRQWPKFPSKEVSCRDETQEDMVAIHQPVLKSTTSAGAVRDVRDMRERRDSPVPPVLLVSPRALASRIAFHPGAHVSLLDHERTEAMITPDVLTEYVRQTMPDAAVTVSDRTGTMDHLKVVVISAAFAGKNLLDRHRMIYQALDVPMKDGRIHALEITAKTTDET